MVKNFMIYSPHHILCIEIIKRSAFSCLAMSFQYGHDSAIRYRGFLLLPELNKTWLVRPERSPMYYLPFRVSNSSSEEVKREIDMLLLNENQSNQAA